MVCLQTNHNKKRLLQARFRLTPDIKIEVIHEQSEPILVELYPSEVNIAVMQTQIKNCQKGEILSKTTFYKNAAKGFQLT